MLAAVLLLLALWVVFFLWGRRLPASTWARVFPGFDLAERAFGPSPVGWVPKVVAIWLGILTLGTAGLVVLAHFWNDLQRSEVRARIYSNTLSLAAFYGLLVELATKVYANPQYDIQTMMTNPRTVPVFGQRLLLVWPAMLLKHLVPQLSFVTAFDIIQAIGIAIAIYLIGEWSALFVGRLKFLGQIIMALFLLPTFVYLQGHDVGVVITYTLCFLLLYKRQYWFFGLALCVGMLNHQNILLLIPTAVVILWNREKPSKILWLAVLTTAAYFTIQVILNTVLPIPQTHEPKVWWNMRLIAEMHKNMLYGAMTIVPWYVAAAAALGSADPFLKRATVLFPMQVGVFFLYGQLNEARIFNGFLPVVIGILLCFLRDHYLEVTDGRRRPQISRAECPNSFGGKAGDTKITQADCGPPPERRAVAR